MKKALLFPLVAIMLLASTVVASAQSGFYWGPKVNVNFTKFKDISSGYNTGFDVGLALGMDISIFGVEAAALYSKEKGGELITNSIDVPVIAKLYVFQGLHIYAGPQFNIGLNQKYTIDDIKTTIDGDVFSGGNVSGVFGVGYKFSKLLNVGLTYNLGALSFEDDNSYSFGSAVQDLSKIKSSTISIALGVRF